MAAMSKGALTITSLATALLFGGGIFLFLNFGSIAKNLSEEYASRTLGVDVTIGEMEVFFKARKIDVYNVKIANPEGYQNPYAVTVDKIDIHAGTLSSELLEFKDVFVQKADVYLEVKPTATNLTDIRKNMNTNVGAEESAGEKALRVILDKMVMNGTIHPTISFLNQPVNSVKLPEIRLEGIGRNENGVLVGQAVGQVWHEIASQTIAAANRNGYLQGLDRDALEEAGISETEILKDQINQEVDKLKEGVKSLFE